MQYCALARALDLIGERWSLLLIREFMTGPKRYKDLLDGLKGIGTNLLAARLRNLETNGLIERVNLPPPAASTVYRLSPRGRDLEPAVLALIRWGFEFLDGRRAGEISRAHWDIVAMKAAFQPEAAGGIEEEYELRLDNEIFYVRVNDGSVDIGAGAAYQPSVTLFADGKTFSDLGLGVLNLNDALESGKLQTNGSKIALRRMFRLFRVQRPQA